jgi:hypothetical protein
MNSRNPLKYILFVLLISLPIFVKAALTVGADTDYSQNVTAGVTSVSFAHTQATGADGFLIVYVFVPSTTTSTVTYNGTALTKLTSKSNPRSITGEWTIWYLASPATGSRTLQINFAACPYGQVSIQAYSFTGCNGIGNNGYNGSSVLNNTASLTVSANSRIIAGNLSGNNTSSYVEIPSGTSVTKTWNHGNLGVYGYGGISAALSAGSKTAKGGNTDYNAIWAVEILEAVSCTSPSISAHPSTTAVTRCNGSAFSALTVTASGSATLSYQWQQSANGSTGWTNASGGSGSTTASYTPPSTTAGTLYYRCVVTTSCDGTTATSNNSGAHTVRSTFTTGTISSTGETICYGGTPGAIGSSVAASGGDNTITYSWRSSADSYTAAISGATSATYTPPAGLTSTTSYRRYAKDGTCNTTPTVSSGTWTVTVRSQFTTGTISSTGETICYGGTPGAIGSSVAASGGDNTITYSWRSSADGYTAAISGATSATYTPPAGLTSTTSYRRYAKDGTCNTTPTVSSGTWTVTVRSQFTSGTISSTGETICYGGTPGAIGSSVAASGGDNTITYSWRSSADGYTAAISGATSATYTPPAGLTSTTSYRRYAKDGTCNTTPTVSSGTWTVTVRSQFTSGTITTTGETICYGGTPASAIGNSVSASGGDASITYSWRSSADGYTAAIVGATSSTYTPPAGLTSTTSYRRYAQDGTCNTSATVSTGTWTVTVRSQFTSGTITTTGETICYGGTPASAIGNSVSASGGDASITYSWRSSADGYTAAIGGATSSTYTPPAGLTSTTSYRRYAQDGTCNTSATVSTGTWTVTVRDQFTSGTITTTGETICYGGTPASAIGNSVSASGGDASITYSWRSSADGYIAAIVGATSSTYTPPAGLTSTTSYRRYAQDGTCNTSATVSTGTWTVTVRDQFTSGTITTTGETICYGGTPASAIGNSVSASGGDASITYSWRSSADGYTAAIVGATSSTYTPPAGLTSTTSYRRYAQDGTCNTSATVSTGTWTVTVRDQFTSGTITTTGETICYGGTPASAIGNSVSASGGDPSITYSWRSSADGYTAAIVGATSSTYTPPAGLTSTTSYRRYAQDGTCNTSATVSTGTWTVTVRDQFTSGTITTTGETICYGGTPASAIGNSVSASGGDASITYSWRSSADGYTAAIVGATSSTYTPPAGLTSTTSYRRYAQDGTCESATVSTGTWTVTVYADLTAGSISSNQTICTNVVPDSILSTVLPTGGTGAYTYQWQSSTDNATWGNIGGATNKSYLSGSLATTTYFRRGATSGSCGTQYTTSTQVTVNTCAGPGGVTDGIVVWLKADSNTVGSPVTQWQDISKNDKHTTSSTGSPTVTAASLNYNSSINFNGSSGFETDSLDIEQAFVVYKPSGSLAANTGYQILGRKNHSATNVAKVFSFENALIATSNDDEFFSSSTRVRNNGKTTTTISTTATNILSFDTQDKGAIRGTYNIGLLSSGTTYNNLEGEIAEFIAYSSRKTGADLAKIESYLALKYGITLSRTDGGTSGNYYNSGGAVIWNATVDTSYHNDVIGIGKDNTQFLYQKQSKTSDDKLRLFIDDLASSNNANAGSITNDVSYIMVGHNNGSLYSTDSSNAEAPIAIKRRLEREWKITNTNFDDNFSLEIEWDSSGTFDLTHVRLLVDDDGDFSDATVYGTADGLTFSLGSIIVKDINASFIPKGGSKFVTIGSVDDLTVLPVELIYFIGKKNGSTVDLNWETGAEINSDYFEILHSTDGVNFKSIGKVNAAGNSSISQKYSLTHYHPSQGVNYYKLREFDVDGKYEEFKIIFVEFEFTSQNYDFIIYPNPNYNNGAVYLQTNYFGKINFYIFDMEGRSVYQELVNVSNENVNLLKNINLSPGVYPILISSPSNEFLSKTIKLIIQ